MIVRILGESQYEVDADTATKLEQLDGALAAAIESGDEEGFASTIHKLHEMVRSAGSEVSAETIVPSDLTVPHSGASLAEVRELLASEESTGD
jgi:predicted HAD superfamily Cof-like phosphohydrolase